MLLLWLCSFLQACHWPGVLGAVDCTLIQVHPTKHEEALVDHDNDHSLNVQVVGDMDYYIQDIRIVNGSTNDQFVYRMYYSDVRQKMYDLRNNEEIVATEGHYYIIGKLLMLHLHFQFLLCNVI